MRPKMTKLRTAAGIVGVTVLLSAAAATAAHAAPAADPTVYPAGTACAGFDLQVDMTGGNSRTRDFTDQSGTLIRTLITGTGPALTFTNLSTGATSTTPSKGTMIRVDYDADDSTTLTLTGQNLLILGPTDTPAGPTTTVHTGRIVATVDENGRFTTTSTSGQSLDVCATLTTP
jgi:hypothetical protein